VPAQQRLRPHQEDVPAAPRQQPTQRRKQQPIVRLDSFENRCGGAATTRSGIGPPRRTALTASPPSPARASARRRAPPSLTAAREAPDIRRPAQPAPHRRPDRRATDPDRPTAPPKRTGVVEDGSLVLNPGRVPALSPITPLSVGAANRRPRASPRLILAGTPETWSGWESCCTRASFRRKPN
jgi:hypothetical protein